MRQTSSGAPGSLEVLPLLPAKPGFRWSIVLVLSALMVVVTAGSELTWPFINQLIVDIGVAPNPESVGFYSGLIETVASFFGFAMIFPGSVVADLWGRKAVIHGALLGVAIGQTFFGMSRTLFGLIACRSIVYALGPQLAWSTTVTVLGDLADNGNSGAALSAVNAAYRVGQLISPIFPALLAHPAIRHPWFKTVFWESYPYALPCFGGAALCFGGVYMISWCLPETAPGMQHLGKIDEQLEDGYGSVTPPLKNLGTPRPAVTTTQDVPIPKMVSATLEPVVHLSSSPLQPTPFTSRVAQLLISSWIMYFISISFSALFPLWAFTPISSGGLGASENIIGTYISVRAVVHFLALVPFAYCESRLGVYRLYAYSLSIHGLATTLSFPLLNLMVRTPGVSPFWVNLVMGVHFIVVGFGNYCTTCVAMMVNQAAPSPQALSQLVGISQSILAIGQCMAPVITLSIFEFSIKSNILEGNVVWMILFVISAVASAHSFTLRAPVHNK
ncbi:hypothetical protein FRC08_001199 [Ceratobasidium sp. 394]|nr:hypothetical protein FRC08_001199 [Ceratobasidium sp. 394]